MEFPTSTKNSNMTAQAAYKMLMLLSVHMTSILFLIRLNNFTLTMGFYWNYSSRLFLCALVMIMTHVL